MAPYQLIIQSFKDRPNWLPEIFQIGIRNPQGMALSPFNNKVYISNHGAKGGDFFGEVKASEIMDGRFIVGEAPTILVLSVEKRRSGIKDLPNHSKLGFHQ